MFFFIRSGYLKKTLMLLFMLFTILFFIVLVQDFPSFFVKLFTHLYQNNCIIIWYIIFLIHLLSYNEGMENITVQYFINFNILLIQHFIDILCSKRSMCLER
jgi:hypothetical protein